MGDSGTNVRKYIQQFREPPSGCMPNSYEAGAKQELHLCMLIKLRFNNAQMSEIFGVNTTSVSQKKFRLKKHLSDTLQDGLPDEMTLDRWVAEF